MPDDRRFYVYIHRRKTDGIVFYVGKGSGKRAWDRHSRSDWWKSIVARHGFDIVHSSIQNAARHLQKAHPRQISATKISMACRGTRKRAYGYRWEYV